MDSNSLYIMEEHIYSMTHHVGNNYFLHHRLSKYLNLYNSDNMEYHTRHMNHSPQSNYSLNYILNRYLDHYNLGS